MKRLGLLLRNNVFDVAAVASPRTIALLTCFLYTWGGGSAFIASVLPGWSDDMVHWLFIVVGASAMATGIVTGLFGAAWPRWVYHGLVAAGTVHISIVVLASGSPSASAAVSSIYLFVMVDIALYFGFWGMLAQYLFAATALVTTLLMSDVPISQAFIVFMCNTACVLATAAVVRLSANSESDQLTKAATRRGLERTLEHELERAAKHRHPLTLVYLDLDLFKAYNDSFGQLAGDQMLQEVARRWQAGATGSQVVARLAGDKFALVLPGKSLGQAADIADTLRAMLPPGITTSAGVAQRHEGDSPAALISRAEMAVLEAKAGGRNQTSVWGDHSRVASAIEAGLARGEFHLVFQPVFRLPGEEIASYEALIRWTHPERGAMSPADFIPRAESTGAIHAIGAWTVREVVRVIAVNSTPERPVRIAVNASVHELRTSAYVDQVRDALSAHGVDPAQLTVEVTEQVFDGDDPALVDTLAALRDLGVRLAIDDFGSGYSSLRWLDRFPVDILKIDKAFVDPITDPAQVIAVLDGVIEIGRRLGLSIIVEGVETEIQAGVLQAAGVELVQGWLFGRAAALVDDRLPTAYPVADG